jgi:hypothetical protein
MPASMSTGCSRREGLQRLASIFQLAALRHFSDPGFSSATAAAPGTLSATAWPASALRWLQLASSSRRTSCCSTDLTRCWVFQAITRLTPAMTASTAASADHQRMAPKEVSGRTDAPAGDGAGLGQQGGWLRWNCCGGVVGHGAADCTGDRRRRRGRKPAQNRHSARQAFWNAWPAPGADAVRWVRSRWLLPELPGYQVVVDSEL